MSQTNDPTPSPYEYEQTSDGLSVCMYLGAAIGALQRSGVPGVDWNGAVMKLEDFIRLVSPALLDQPDDAARAAYSYLARERPAFIQLKVMVEDYLRGRSTFSAGPLAAMAENIEVLRGLMGEGPVVAVPPPPEFHQDYSVSAELEARASAPQGPGGPGVEDKDQDDEAPSE